MCVFFSLFLFSCFCWSPGWVFGYILVFEKICFSWFYWGPTGWRWVGSASCSFVVFPPCLGGCLHTNRQPVGPQLNHEKLIVSNTRIYPKTQPGDRKKHENSNSEKNTHTYIKPPRNLPEATKQKGPATRTQSTATKFL